jgi:hypothetical protein
VLNFHARVSGTNCVGNDGEAVQGNTLDIEVEVRWEGDDGTEGEALPAEAAAAAAAAAAASPVVGLPLPHGRLVLSVLGAEDGSEETRVVIDTAYNSGWCENTHNTLLVVAPVS